MLFSLLLLAAAYNSKEILIRPLYQQRRALLSACVQIDLPIEKDEPFSELASTGIGICHCEFGSGVASGKTVSPHRIRYRIAFLPEVHPRLAISPTVIIAGGTAYT